LSAGEFKKRAPNVNLRPPIISETIIAGMLKLKIHLDQVLA